MNKANIEARIKALVDPEMYEKDAYYHAQVSLLRSWLSKIEMALQDEEVDPEVIEQVLNRLIYATPSGAEAYERIEINKQQVDLLSRGKP